MKVLSSLFVLVAAFVSLTASASEFQVHCQKFSAPLTGGFCVHAPVGGKSRDLVYHLHGLGGDERLWQSQGGYPEQVRREWAAQGKAAPTVISISLGQVWLLAPKNASPYSGAYELVTQKIIPSIESALGGLKGRRLLVGESMGGFNSVQLALKTELFSKVAILCSPMAELSPFATDAEVEAFVQGSRAWNFYKDTDPELVRSSVRNSIDLAKAFFPTPADWTMGDPLTLAAGKKASYPALYVSVGIHDPYVNYEGNEKFVSILRAKGAQVEWHPLEGGHCPQMDIPSLAKFLVD